MIVHGRFLMLFGVALVVASGCASRDKQQGVAEVPECRQAAKAVPATEFDSRTLLLQLRADAYSACMEQHGYVLDQEEFDRRLLHQEQVKNSDPMGGDPAFILARYRQELRMDPSVWRGRAR